MSETPTTFSSLIDRTSELFTREQAANYLGITPATLAVWASLKRYDLPYIKVGRLVKYRRIDLDAFIARHTILQADA